MGKVRIFDSSFTPFVKSFSLREENKDVHPTHFEWTTEGEPTKTTFIANGEIKNVVKHLGEDYWYPGVYEEKYVVALLTEPPDLHPEDYQAAYDLHGKFSHVLTYSKEWHEKMDGLVGNTRFYPLGGSSIALEKWKVYPKSKSVCMIVSDKKTTEGHKLRHKIAEEFGDRIDLYGAGVGKPFDSKFEVLKDYRYCIVVESCEIDSYFSEKLIDALSVGCHPVYWGCPNIFSTYFDFLSAYQFEEDMEYFRYVFDCLDPLSYEANKEFVEANMETAKKYRIAEDWIYENYKDLFE